MINNITSSMAVGPPTTHDDSTPQVRDHDRFTQGDFTLISSDKVRFRVDSHRLFGASPAFQAAKTLAGDGERKLELGESIEASRVIQLFLEMLYDNRFTSAPDDGINPIEAARVIHFMKRFDCTHAITGTINHLVAIHYLHSPLRSFAAALIAACVAKDVNTVAGLLNHSANKVPTTESVGLTVMSKAISDYDIRGFAYGWLAMIPFPFLIAIMRATAHFDGGSNNSAAGPGTHFREILQGHWESDSE